MKTVHIRHLAMRMSVFLVEVSNDNEFFFFLLYLFFIFSHDNVYFSFSSTSSSSIFLFHFAFKNPKAYFLHSPPSPPKHICISFSIFVVFFYFHFVNSQFKLPLSCTNIKLMFAPSIPLSLDEKKA